jgi:Flp pilus assembly pilin Flp
MITGADARLLAAVNRGECDDIMMNTWWWLARVWVLRTTTQRDQSGQSTVEYALVLVGVAAVAVFVFRWLQTSGLLEDLFRSVFRDVNKR